MLDTWLLTNNLSAVGLRILPVKDRDGWTAHVSSVVAQQERWLERGLFGSPPLTMQGYCAVCDNTQPLHITAHHSSVSEQGGIQLAFSETGVCNRCRTNSRMRAAIHLLRSLGCMPGSKVYLTEQCTNLYNALQNSFHNLTGSEFLGDKVPLGHTDEKGYRNEDIQALTFESETFDFVVSLDVLEHIPDSARATVELLRILKPGGTAILTFPFSPNRTTSLRRATLETLPTGLQQIRHIERPQYHGNPLLNGGSLVFQEFGFDIVEMASALKCESLFVNYWSWRSLHLGSHRFSLILHKPGA